MGCAAEKIEAVHFSEYDMRLAAYAAIVDDEGRLLLAWWNGEDHGVPGFSMPGGGVEFDESLEEAVEREVFEETGYTVRVGAPIATHSFTIPAVAAMAAPTSQCESCSRR